MYASAHEFMQYIWAILGCSTCYNLCHLAQIEIKLQALFHDSPGLLSLWIMVFGKSNDINSCELKKVVTKIINSTLCEFEVKAEGQKKCQMNGSPPEFMQFIHAVLDCSTCCNSCHLAQFEITLQALSFDSASLMSV